MVYRAIFTTLLAISAVSAHGHHDISNLKVRQGDNAQPFSAARFPDIQRVLQGNAEFRQTRNAAQFQALVEDGQKPPAAIITCSDSRTPEATIFNSEPGTFFVERNIANQYKPGDENAQSVINYGVRVLGVQHIIVMGHYGCGGVAAAIASAPRSEIDVAGHIIQSWIGDVRQLYLSSNRSEVVEMRTANLAREAAGEIVEEPDRREPGFRALVEENVKVQVQRLAQSSLMLNLNAEVVAKLNVDGSPREGQVASENSGFIGVPPEGGRIAAEEELPLIPVFIHGWVHDIETGEVIDLNISTGPAGFENFVPTPQAGEGEQPAPVGGEQPAPAPTPVGGEQPPAEQPPAEGGAQPPAESGAEAPSEGAAQPPAESGAVEGGAQPISGETRADTTIHGVHFVASAGGAAPAPAPAAAPPAENGGVVPVRAKRMSASRLFRARDHAEDETHAHDRRDHADAHDEVHDRRSNERLPRQYPPPIKMLRRLSSSA